MEYNTLMNEEELTNSIKNLNKIQGFLGEKTRAKSEYNLENIQKVCEKSVEDYHFSEKMHAWIDKDFNVVTGFSKLISKYIPFPRQYIKPDVLALATQRGDYVHRQLDNYIKGKEVDYFNINFKTLNKFINYLKYTQKGTYLSEVKVKAYLDTNVYISILDLVKINNNGTISIYDWKTNTKTGQYKKWALQLNFYKMLMEKLGYKVKETAVLWYNIEKSKVEKIQFENQVEPIENIIMGMVKNKGVEEIKERVKNIKKCKNLK